MFPRLVWRVAGAFRSRTSAARDLIIITFLVAQALDGALTYVGVAGGAATESNPLLAWYVAAFGLGPTLTGAKLLAGGCAIGLHLANAHLSLAALTVLYALAAVGPWTAILAS